MPTLNQVRNALNNRLAALWDIITGKQDEYYQNHGSYWQGLKTHVFYPKFWDASGEAVIPDNLESTPTDQTGTNWNHFLPAISGSPISGALVMDVYNGPLGQGYVASVYVTHENTTYMRSQNYGPETWRTQNWTIVPTGG